MESWKSTLKKGLRPAIKAQNKTTIATFLRQGAKQAHMTGEKELALKLMEFALDFAEGTNVYFYCLSDYHHYRTGETLESPDRNIHVPSPHPDLPWQELESFLNTF